MMQQDVLLLKKFPENIKINTLQTILYYCTTTMIESKLNLLADLLIRPRRRSYAVGDLGPTYFKTKYGSCVRTDFEVEFQYGQTYGYPHPSSSQHHANNLQQNTHKTMPKQPILLHCSIFTPTTSRHKTATTTNPIHQQPHQQPHKQKICMLAMHGNTGSRISTLNLVEPAMKCGLMLAIFDFAGCGNSEGDYVTLGYYEKYQIAAVMEAIHGRFGCEKFLLYGRSMGAASALFYSAILYPLYTQHKTHKILTHYTHLLTNPPTTTTPLTPLDPDYPIPQILHLLNTGYFGYEIIGLVLDSPYHNARDMIMDAVAMRAWLIPRGIVGWALGIVEGRAIGKLEANGIMAMDQEVQQEQPQKQDNQKKQQKDINKPSIFSLINSIKIPQNHPPIPFPIYLLYGLQDNVISQTHTWSLFKSLNCDNKKLHILEDQGHGGHRDDETKIRALQWILDIEKDRSKGRIQRYCEILGRGNIVIPKKSQYKIEMQQVQEERMGSMLIMDSKRQKQKEKATEVTSEQTGSMASLKVCQVQAHFGSITSMEQLD